MEQSDVSAEAEVEQHFADRPFEDCRPGRRLDTLHIHKLPIRCFKAPGLKGPSAEQIASVFGQFGGLVRFQVVQTGADGSLNFQLYLQYVEPIVARERSALGRGSCLVLGIPCVIRHVCAGMRQKILRFSRTVLFLGESSRSP